MSRIEQHSLEALLEKARLEEVVAQWYTLGTRGVNRKGECPFCKEPKKFSVNTAKQLYKCFGCGEGGNSAVKFLQKARGMKFQEAAQWLADFYKMELRREVPDSATGTGGADFDRSYFDQRMAELGYRQDRPDTKGLFRPHSSGGIEIYFPALREDDGPWQMLGEDEPFVRMRLHPSRTSSTQKYSQPADSGVHIFIPPSVVAMYREGKQVQSLFVVEGEFKAFAMAQEGVPIVGITGIWMWQRAAKKKELHPDLQELIRVLRPVTVAFVLDADCMQLKWDRIAEPEKDLAKRLKDFAGAVAGFRMAVGVLAQRVVMTAVRKDFIDTAKGVDDLAQLKGAEDVAVELTSLSPRSNLFTVFDMTDATHRKINGHFHLNLYGGVPKDFYDTYARQLEDHNFCFQGAIYRYDPDTDGGKLIMERHQDSDLFRRVGCDYYRFVELRDEHNNPIQKMVPWKEAIINRDYVKKGFVNFFDTIETFDAFDTIPGHHEDYQEWIETTTGRLYNRYKPLRTVPKKGSWATIERYLKHVIGEQLVKSIDEAGKVHAESPAWVAYLDYLTIMYRFPLQRLPAVCPVSEAKQTGKSKLLELNCAMWESNATMMGNEQLTDEFNGDWVYNQFVGIDETLLDKKHQQERMKRLITGTREQLRSMYKDREATKLLVKFHFTSNNADSFISVDDDDLRYWIIEVPAVPVKDPLLLEKMVAEIPALFHELRTRTIVHPRLGRLWFSDSVIRTEAHAKVAANSRGYVEGNLRELIEEQFHIYRWPELYFNISQITKMLTDAIGKVSVREVRRVLDRVMKVGTSYGRIIVPYKPERRASEKKTGDKDRQRFFVFRACDFVPEEVAADIMRSARAEWATSTDRLDDSGSDMGELPLVLKHPDYNAVEA